MVITKQTVAEKIGDYLHHGSTLEQLVDWAEDAMREGELHEPDMDTLRTVIARLGVADVRAFGLTWENCQDMLRQLGYSARVEIATT